MKIANWLLLVVLSSPIVFATAQEERIEIISDAKPPLPMPLEGGSRWLRFALRTPQARQSLLPSPTTRPDVTSDVQALEGVHQRIGSVVSGTLFDGIGTVSPAERQQIWKGMAAEWRVAEAERAQQTAYSQQVIAESQFSEAYDPTLTAIAQLRASARNLDQAAADLEDVGKYAAADRLRASANRLRHEARDFASEQE